MYTADEYPLVLDTILRTMEESGTLYPANRSAFFNDLRIDYISESFIALSTTDDSCRQILIDRFRTKLEEAASDVCRSPMKIDITLRNPEPQKLEGEDTTISPLRRAEELAAEREKAAAREKSSENVSLPHTSSYTFDNFIVGSSNKFAHAAALAVANNPGSAYNPLFIYGPSGLGKTHLMFAIVNELRRKDPDIRAIYITGEDFTNQMVTALQNHTSEDFRAKFRSADALLVDDVQFISGKTGTQEEFFHTFNALYNEGKQIILTSDRPPKEIATLEERIRTRFEQGLIADIGLPNYELRLAILTSKAEAMKMNVSHSILSYFAEVLSENNRQLEGVLVQLSMQMKVSEKQTATMEMAEACVVALRRQDVPVRDMVQKILDAVCEQYALSNDDLTGGNRSAPVKNPRNMAMYLIRTMTGMSYPDIGKMFNNRNHSTIMSNIDSFEKQMKADPTLEKELEDVKRKI